MPRNWSEPWGNTKHRLPETAGKQICVFESNGRSFGLSGPESLGWTAQFHNLPSREEESREETRGEKGVEIRPAFICDLV